MCGVVAIVYLDDNPGLGREGSFLLKKLEYRGYDSTGAVFFKRGGATTLKKKVGAPTQVVQELEIDRSSGFKFIGQVRWATYGSVTECNAQPHEVNCVAHLAGAHNGNISNTDTLKGFLSEHGHRVVSDNDGEILVHLIEHHYGRLLGEGADASEERKVAALLAAIRKANEQAIGSYAAAITLPEIAGVFAVKAGSSLYAGKGSDENGDFILVSSDLTSVLSKTRFLIPLCEGEAIYFTSDRYEVYTLADGEMKVPGLKRSKLNVADISLQQKYNFFMEQEIFSTPASLNAILQYYFPNALETKLFAIFERHAADCTNLINATLRLYDIFDSRRLREEFLKITADPRFRAMMAEVGRLKNPAILHDSSRGFASPEAQLFHELHAFGEEYFAPLLVLDQIVIWKRKRKVLYYKKRLLKMMREAAHAGKRIFFIGAGTSYHAALTGGAFFNSLAGGAVIPCNPGFFRTNFLQSLKKGDILLGITQSGETKDLIDIFNDVRERYGADIARISLINNENSAIPQEKSDFFLPLLCGPEIAVAATKSFIHQIAVFYLLAWGMKNDDASGRLQMEKIRHLLEYTLKICEEDVSELALRLFLRPSLHILGTSLIGLAREGALKIREVVLNHAEGYDAAEFKHGPNTILGKSTIYSLRDMEDLIADFSRFSKELRSTAAGPAADQLLDLIKDFQFRDFSSELLAETAEPLVALFKRHIDVEKYFSNYPLIFVCPPAERDRRITITQIHTHKIRGADIVLIAEQDEDLGKAVAGRPAAVRDYYSKYVQVPRSGDANLFVFEAAVVLQLLALKMSVLKLKYLNKARVANHGVHPDVPKNVSKSITVD